MGLLYTGVDIVEIKRIGSIMEKHPAFIERFFTEREMSYFIDKRLKAEHIAAGFAAKEAVSKCIGGLIGIKLKDIEVLRGGRPEVRLWGRAKQKAELMGIGYISVSISHSSDYAVAFAVAKGGDCDVSFDGGGNESNRQGCY
ncbi:holo-ACP synthase [Calorimonas adulescens]|uniref:Holo-[acyl-carrier-protein] synthase n=1 Tax=Calorimonas adulescens TaxID=2606906 RepID=A0A5D8Q952_9THEO|nr:holo-ACP synthase [Calorimonas adulescens]TZE81110.1 holo-[acyl-carrier-protein] synthase [Calorimonas adulescens]